MISKTLGTTALVAGVSSLEQEYPANFLTFVEHGRITRHVSARRDDAWEFYEQGPRLPLEDAARYSARLKKDRVPPEYVVEIVTRYGFPIATPGFWKSSLDGWYFRQVA